jgi:mycothiol synthase
VSLQARPYRDEDLAAVQAALAGWIAETGGCGYCHPGDVPQRIYAQLRGRRPVGELVRVWEEGGAVVAFAICFRFETAFDLFASPRLRGSDVERELLRETRDRTAALKLGLADADPYVVTDVDGCDAARQAQLERLGFERYRVWDYLNERSLDAPVGDPPLPPGFVLRRAAAADAAQLAAVRNSAFGGGWSAEEYREQVMRKPGYSPERELVAVAPDGRAAAFTVIGVDERNASGLLEPVGTHADFRRMGLARAVIVAALYEMRRLGLRTATVSHDATNRPALELYRSLGFTARHETLGYRYAPQQFGC